MIALDGGDRLSYAEFAVFVTDPHHSELQEEVCRQAAEQLEGLGRRSFNLDAAFRQVAAAAAAAAAAEGVSQAVGGDVSSSGAGGDTWPEVAAAPQQKHQHVPQKSQCPRSTTAPGEESVLGQQESSGLAAAGTGAHAAGDYRHGSGGGGGDGQGVSAEVFLAGLRSLGLRLSVSDAHRLILRFDVHGDGHLSARRFVTMVENSPPWTRALAWLAHQEEVDEEADACLRARRAYGEWPPALQQGQGQGQGRGQGQGQSIVLSTDIVEMARYIGIRVCSDSSLLWIAADALAAPLPNGWVMHAGKEGRWFYHNELTGESARCDVLRPSSS